MDGGDVERDKDRAYRGRLCFRGGGVTDCERDDDDESEEEEEAERELVDCEERMRLERVREVMSRAMAMRSFFCCFCASSSESSESEWVVVASAAMSSVLS